MTNQEIGKRIAIARNKAGLNKKELAKKVNVSPSTITRYENGDFERVKIAILEVIAKTTGVNPMWLSGNSETMETLDFAETYHFDPEAAEITQEVLKRPELRALFKATRGVKPDNVLFAADMLEKFKETNPDG